MQGWRAAVVAGALVVAGTPVFANAASRATPCGLVTDPSGDAGYTTDAEARSTDPGLDLVSADIASDDRLVTAVFRLARPQQPGGLVVNAVYRFEFSVAGSADRFYLAFSGPNFGTVFDAGYLGAQPTSLGTATGSMSRTANEVHVHAPLSLFAPRARIRRGTVLSGFHVVTLRSVPYGPSRDTGALVADEASSTRTYRAGTRTCVRVGDMCAPLTDHYVAGTVKGEDGLDANVQVSVAFVSSDGEGVGWDGCPVNGYGGVVRLNTTIPSTGARHSAKTTNTWRVGNLPANVTKIWVEAYPLGPDGKVTHVKYGGSLRRRVPVNRGDIVVRLPVVCAAHGRTGTIAGSVVDRKGHAVAIDRAIAWSEAPDSQQQILGWGVGTTHDTNRFEIPALARDQKYSVWVSRSGKATWKTFHVAVSACHTTSIKVVT
jgi:hypothetical protein